MAAGLVIYVVEGCLAACRVGGYVDVVEHRHLSGVPLVIALEGVTPGGG